MKLFNARKLAGSACETAAKVRSGEVTAAAIVEDYLAGIAELDGELNAYTQVWSDYARKQAAELDEKIAAGHKPGLLAGVPIAIKENICTEFGKTTCCSEYLSEFSSPYNAEVIDRLIAADAILIGKTNMDEFAMGSSTENSSNVVTRNPHDLSRVPGGSSGGSAAATAALLCGASLGSDTGGSIRQPAGFCGVVGVKPTYGRVSRRGLVAFASSLDQIGPMTQNVTDAAAVLQVIAGHDSRDATSLKLPAENFLADLDKPVENLRIGLPTEILRDDIVDAEVLAAVRNAAEFYKSAGAEVVEVSLPHSKVTRGANGLPESLAVAAYYIIASAECSSNLARFDGVCYGKRAAGELAGVESLYEKSRGENLGDEVIRRIMLGTFVLLSGYYDAYYDKAMCVRRLIANDFAAAFKTCDAILCPTSPTTAFKIGERADDPLAMYLADIFTISPSLAGLPAVSLPAGFDSQNLPIGIQLIGNACSEAKLLRIARQLEKMHIKEKPVG